MCAPLLLAAVPAMMTAMGGASGVAAISGGIGALGSIATFLGTQSAHHAAVQTANLNYAAKDEQTQRENVQTSQQQTEQNLTDAVKQAQTFGQVATSASALGLGQFSSNQLLTTSAVAYNRTLGINAANYDNKRANIQTELQGASLKRSSDIAAAPKANLGTLALSLAGNALSSVSTYGALGGKFGVKPAA